MNADYYRTDFINQVIVDLDQNVNSAVFYNLDGESYSNSLQFELIIEPFLGWTVNTAYRWNDVKQTINGELMQKPMISPHKGFLNIEYQTYNEDWLFDVTLEFNGEGRLPNTSGNPEEFQRPNFYDPFVLMHAQITKKFDTFEIYLGGENLTNFRQSEPIIAADDPFGEHFDSSMIYAPIFGQNIYLGVRYNL
jgi:outer membrane receptor protein involved in Fe transport